MPGDRYTQQELSTMSREDFERAARNNFERPTDAPETFTFNVADAAARAAAQGAAGLTSMAPSQINLRSAAPTPTAAPDPNAWATAKTKRSKDFTCPSGQTCRLRPLSPETLLEAGILDRITRLEGLASVLVDQAEGAPPKAATPPSRDDFKMLLGTINQLVILAVETPHLYEEDETVEGEENVIRVTDVDLEDRMAIMEEALRGLKLLDRFRNPR